MSNRTLPKAAGLAWIMHELDRGWQPKMADICKELGISRRTGERYINDLALMYPLGESGNTHTRRYFRVGRLRRTA